MNAKNIKKKKKNSYHYQCDGGIWTCTSGLYLRTDIGPIRSSALPKFSVIGSFPPDVLPEEL